VVTALCGVQFVDVMGGTLVLTALPSMLTDLGGGGAGGTAVVTAYALTFGGLMMLGARLGDRHGHRRVLMQSIALFAGACAVGGLAGSVWVLAASRAVQGAAAAASVPCALRLLTTIVPEGSARRRAIAAWSAAGAAAGASGFVVGGLLTELVSWRAAAGVGSLLGAGLVLAVWRLVPADELVLPRPSVPWLNGVVLTVATMGAVLGPTVAGEGDDLGAGVIILALGVAAGAGFVMLERRGRARLVPRAAWEAPTVRWGVAGSFANTATTSSSVTVATLYLQDVLEISPLAAAGTLVSFSISVVLAATATPPLLRRVGWRGTTGLGLTLIAVGNFGFALSPTIVGIALASGVCGLGIGVASVAATDMGTTIDPEAKSSAAALLNTGAQLGTAGGVAAAILIAESTSSITAWSAMAVAATVAAIIMTTGAPTSPPPTPTPVPPREGAAAPV
jgi:MFS family permease